MLRRYVLLVAIAVMVVVMAAVTSGPVFAAAGGNLHGEGQGVGGGNAAHIDDGNHTATGDGALNNPHVTGGCTFACTP